MKKAALLSLLSILLPLAAFPNGVERGQDVIVPSPVLTPLMQEYLATEVNRRCDFVASKIVPQTSFYAGNQLFFRAMAEVQGAEGETPASVAITAAGEAVSGTARLLEVDSPRCTQ